MIIKRFSPGIALTLTVAVALGLLIALGTWQLQKSGPKTRLLAQIEAGLKAEPITLALHVDDPTAIEYRKVSFKGMLYGSKSARVFGLNLAGQPGYFIYAPMKRPAGQVVIVNFGWIPLNSTADPKLPRAETKIRGVLLRSGVPGMMTPENRPADGVWYTADVHALAAYFGLGTKEYYHFRIIADQITGGAVPLLGGQVIVVIPNNHFQYALTWYGLGLALVGVYLAYGFKKRENQP
jgi:surfeit locus 1 family protein